MFDRLLNNDPTAFEELYKECFATVFRHVQRNSGTLQDAEDLFQDALLIVVRNIHKADFVLTGKIGNYLITIAKNLWLNVLRERKKAFKYNKSQKETGSERENYQASEDFGGEIEEIDNKGIHPNKIKAALAKLGEECREILIAIYYHEEKPKDMADELGHSRKYIRVKKFRCMKKLKDLLS